MKNRTASSVISTKYDIIHFEALGPEANHLEEEILTAKQEKKLPENHSYLITPDNVQVFLKENPGITLPEIITTKTHSVLPEGYLDGGRKSIVTRSAGYDHFEHLTDRANIASLREYCVNAVAQTAIKFLYAAAGLFNHYAKNIETFERKNSDAFMELNRNRTLTVFGVGKIGKRIYELAEANGLAVQGVDIRQEELHRLYSGTVRFVSKEEAIISSDIIINAMNLTKNRESRFYNVGYFSQEYLSTAKDKLIFINVTRGEIAPESVLLDLYSSGRIRGIGLDVFTNESEFARLLLGEPVTGADLKAAHTLVKKSLDRSANIYVQPHQGFNSDIAAKAKAIEAIKHVAAWYKNEGRWFDEQLPYY
ncbi:MAG: Glycerate dehydrogenase [Syntrophorhabdus sp. PtaU1.Bin153]|nr:MAG: Glycerate dehydrogenase [Syntrophorhabdus sp. PtaU1.Bin153]